jgi:alkaline phosphatase D
MRLTSRRDFMRSTAAMAGAVRLVGLAGQLQVGDNAAFRHGVASGDPLADRVILWTRVSSAASRRRALVGGNRCGNEDSRRAR